MGRLVLHGSEIALANHEIAAICTTQMFTLQITTYNIIATHH